MNLPIGYLIIPSLKGYHFFCAFQKLSLSQYQTLEWLFRPTLRPSRTLNQALYIAFERYKDTVRWVMPCDQAQMFHDTFKNRLRESARFLEVKPQKKPRNPYRNRKKPAGTEKPYRNFARYLAVYLAGQVLLVPPIHYLCLLKTFSEANAG